MFPVFKFGVWGLYGKENNCFEPGMLEADCKIKCWIMSHALWCVFTADSISITLND